MILSRPVSILCKHLKHNLQRRKTSKARYDTSISKPADEEKPIIVHIDQQVMTIGINRPKQKNSLDLSTAQYLTDALNAFEENKEVLIGILHGVGGNFCSGYDLFQIAKHHGKKDLPQFGPLSNRDSLPAKPLIAAVDGFAIGVGLELALMCDLRIVDETAVFGFLNRRFGIPIMCGGTVRLPKLIGYSRAMDMILTGRVIRSKEALEFGLANSLVGVGTALGQALLLASKLTFHPQKSLLADRLSAHESTFSNIHINEALQFEKDNAANLLFEIGVKEAQKFVDGLGRHGKIVNYTVKEKIRDISDDLL